MGFQKRVWWEEGSDTCHGALVSGPLRLHEAWKPSQQAILATQLLPELHDGIQVITGQWWQDTIGGQRQHVVGSSSARHWLYRVTGFRHVVRIGLIRRWMLLLLHEVVVCLLNLMLLEIGQTRLLLLLPVTALGLPVAALRL